MRTVGLWASTLAAIVANAAAQPPAATQPPTPSAPAAPVDSEPSPAALIGKAPPPFKVAKWVKGEAMKETGGFEAGKVYVVDFWATWCGPCKAAIPHLSKLAQEHKGKVEVIGVSISERQKGPEDTAYIAGVEKFVEKMGDRMDYRVAVDTPDKRMHATWFKPTGLGGIPTAYIIDQKGLVAWIGIGEPRVVERIVTEVLAGTFDPKQEAERAAREEKEAKERAAVDIAAARERSKGTDEKYPGYREATERGDTAAAIEALNQAFKADPESETSGAYQWKLTALLRQNKPEQVNAYARELLDKYPDNGDIAGFVSAVTVQADEDKPRFDAAIALEAAQKSLATAKPESRWQQFARWRLGWAHYHVGDRSKAVESMQAALDGIAKHKNDFDFGNLEDECQEAMKVFKKAAN